MANERPEAENTDLIDVSDVEPRFEDEVRGHEEEISEHIPGIAAPAEAAGPIVADLKDRFSAFVIDAACLYVLYWVSMVAFRSVAVGTAAGPIPAAGINGIVFHGIFLFLALLWFVIPEFALSASFGKLLCHLTIRKTDGTYAGFISVLLRNLLRPLDVILFPLFIVAALMEWSGWHQRLGDLVGRTIVLRKLGAPPRQHALSLDIIATACGRMIAFAIDLVFIAAFVFGFGLLLNPEKPLASMLFVVFFPVALAIFLALPEWLTRTSLGKWIFGLTVCHEDGTALDLSSALIRTIWRLFDTNPMGFLTCLFSLRRQRPGDIAAGTVVIKAPREWRGLFGFVGVFLIAGGTLYSGLQNRDSFLHEGFEINFLPSIEAGALGLRGRPVAPANLMTKNFIFAAGDPTSVRKPSIFQPGETLFIIFDVDGYTRKDERVWLQEDLSVRYPDDNVGLKLENINDFNQEVLQEGPIRFENNIAIPDNAQPGRYTVTLTIRDMLSRRELKEQRFFYVTPPETGASPLKAPAGALPPPAEEPLPVVPTPPKSPDVQSNLLKSQGKDIPEKFDEAGKSKE